jgi:hypothetical protein
MTDASVLAFTGLFFDGGIMVPRVAAHYFLRAQGRDLCRELSFFAQISGSGARCRRKDQNLGRLAMLGSVHRRWFLLVPSLPIQVLLKIDFASDLGNMLIEISEFDYLLCSKQF